MKKIFLLIFTLSSFTYAQNIGSGLSFLKLGVGAKSIAMGEAYTGISHDASSLYYNPAAISFIQQSEISLMHKEWISGTSVEYIGAISHTENFSFGFSVNSTNISDIEIRTQPGPLTGTFGSHNLAISGAVSVPISSSFSFGITGKFLLEKIYVDDANGYAFDFGGFYQLNKNFSFGAAIANIGTMNSLRSEKTILPTTLRFGASYNDVITDNINFLVSTDILKILEDKSAHFHFGSEFLYDNLLAARFGYQVGYEAKKFSTGIGILYSFLRFDYAYVPFTSTLGNTHTFSLTFNL